MSKRTLVLDAFHNKPVSRVPIGFWFHFTAEDKLYAGIIDRSVLENSLAGHKKFFKIFQPDFIKIMSDGWFDYPNIQAKHITSAADLYKLKPIGNKHEWIVKQIEHVKKLTDIFGHEIVSFYNIFSPSKYFRLLYGKIGDNLLARLIAEDKQAVGYALNVIADDLSYLAEGVIKHGLADGIYFSVQSIQDQTITSELYSEVIEPSDLKVLAAANQASENNILHICGYEGSRNNLRRFINYEARVINWAVHVEGVDLATGKKMFGDRAVLGGFDNRVEGLLNVGSQQSIEEAVIKIINDAGTTGIILGADCSLPADIDLRRLEWVRQKAASLY